MSERLPTAESLDSLLAKIDALIGLSSGFPQRRSEIRIEDPRDRYRYEELWKQVDEEIGAIRASGFLISNPNLHHSLASMWAWCISFDESWGAIRTKPRSLYQNTIEYLRQLRQVIVNADAPIEAQRELRESARRTNELFVVIAFRPETDQFRGAIKDAASTVGLSAVLMDEAEPEAAISEAILSSIRRSTLVLCDLTFERPNCYFEAGFAKGAMRRVLFSCRADHNLRTHPTSEHRVHFDVDQFKITWWDPDDLDSARNELEDRLHTLLREVRPSS
jgi:hypothetical protein